MKPKSHAYRRRPAIDVRFIGAAAAMTATLAVFIGCAMLRKASASSPSPANALLLGDRAAIAGELDVLSIKPIDLNGVSRAELERLRREAASVNPGIIADGYTPSPAITGIESGRQWNSTARFYLFGPGDLEIEDAPSKESIHLMNPLQLIGVEFWGATIWSGGAMGWDEDRLSRSGLSFDQLPIYPTPRVRFKPSERRVTVRYDLSSHLRELNALTKGVIQPGGLQLGLIAYNARDLGFTRIGIDRTRAEGVKLDHFPADPFEIRDQLGAGDLCWNGERCNGRILHSLEQNLLGLTFLPARIPVLLWREAEASGAVAAGPDLEVLIEIN